MANQLNVGDVVKLNSGGPDMTVAVLRPSAREAICTWLDGNGTRCAEFKMACLTLVRPAALVDPLEPTPLEKAAEEYRLAGEEIKATGERVKAKREEVAIAEELCRIAETRRSHARVFMQRAAGRESVRSQLVQVRTTLGKTIEQIRVLIVDGVGYQIGNDLSIDYGKPMEIVGAGPVQAV